MYRGYYFQEGKTSYRLVAVAIEDSSVLSVRVHMSIKSSLEILSAETWTVKTVDQETCNFEEYLTFDEDIHNEVDRRR